LADGSRLYPGGDGIHRALWKPIYNLLEGDLELLVVNAQPIKAVPGRKTDVKDAEWIADLLRHGLLCASFIPDRPQRELRELTRCRTTLIQERANEVNRLQKVLEGATIKRSSVATDILGKYGRAILDALVRGSADAAALAQLARGRMREKIPQLEQALAGQFSAHQRLLIAQQLIHIDCLDASLERVNAEIAARLRPFDAALERLQTIPGVGRRTAEILVAEIGVDLTRFPAQPTLRPGQACALGMTRARANADPGGLARAALGCARRWSKRRRRRRVPRRRNWRRSTGDCPPGAGSSAQRWPSRTPCS
jgi:transposase